MKKIKIIICFLFFPITILISQTFQGAFSPQSFTTNNSIGTIDWVNSSNILSSDNNRARTPDMSSGEESYYLVVTDFGFTIPSNGVIDGIIVEIERSTSGGSGNIRDNSVMIVQNNIIGGTDQSAGGNWPISDAYRTYGSSTNLWGLSWSYSDINSNNFGVAISIQKSGSGTNRGRIDHIRITVYYTVPLPIELIEFKVNNENNYNSIKWSTVSEINNDYFILYKSFDARNWMELFITKGAGNSNTLLTYKYDDKDINYDIIYYKLKQVDFDGRYSYSKIISINNDQNVNETYKIYDLYGREINKELINQPHIIKYKNGITKKVLQF